MSLDKFDDIISVIIGESLGLSLLIFAEIFRSLFLGRCLCDLGKSNLEGALSFRADVPLANLTCDISILAHELGQGGAVSGNGKTTGHSILAKPLSILAHHQGTSAWATRRVGNVRSGEAHSLFGESIDVWSWDIRTVITTEISVA